MATQTVMSNQVKHVAYTWFTIPDVVPEKNSGESDVDKALFRPIKDKIKDYIRSGEMLEDMRRLQYHSDMLENLENSEYEDPLLYRGYDLADLQKLHKEAIEDIMERNNIRNTTAMREQNAQEGDVKTDEPAPEVQNVASTETVTAKDSV